MPRARCENAVATPCPSNPLPRRIPEACSTPRRTTSTSHYATALPPRARWLCALLTACLWWVSGQQVGWFALGWIALTPLLWALSDLDSRARWRFGYAGGWLCYACINWWIIPTVAKGSPIIGIPSFFGALLGLLAVTLIALIHGSLVSVCAWVWDTRGWLAQRAPWLLPIIFAILWAALDAARYETQLAHGWGALAYTQWRDTALLQSASVVGQHGLTALCAWFAASLALWLRRGDAILWRAPVVVFLLLHGWGAYRLAHATSHRPPLRVLLIQTDVPSYRKNDEGSGESPYAQAWRLTREGARRGEFDLIVWPETTASLWQPPGASRFLRDREKGGEMHGLDRLSQELQTPILFGAQRWVSPTELYNAAVLLTPSGEESFSAKQRLVPFGERASYSEYLPFLKSLAPSPEVTPGTRTQTLACIVPRTGERLTLGNLICFESCFRYPAHRLALEGAQLLVTITNDEWFAGTNSPWEHAAMATVRAVENQAAVVQAANAGYSFVVDPYGRFVVNRDNTLPATQSSLALSLSTFGVAEAFPVTVSLP